MAVGGTDLEIRDGKGRMAAFLACSSESGASLSARDFACKSVLESRVDELTSESDIPMVET